MGYGYVVGLVGVVALVWCWLHKDGTQRGGVEAESIIVSL